MEHQSNRSMQSLGNLDQALDETFMNCGRTHQGPLTQLGAFIGIAIGSVALVLSQGPAAAQSVDCAGLAARIAALGAGGQKYSNHYGGTAQRQRAELDRAVHNARLLGCDRAQFFLFDTASPQCTVLNAQIQQMQANLAQYQTGGDPASNAAARQQLIASYNAYCRGQVQSPGQPRERGFFETLFSVFSQDPNQNPFFQHPPAEEVLSSPGEDLSPRGGSQALCVRSCDGGFFPLSVSAYQGDQGQLTGLCQALCPNAEVSVYTRAPYQDIKTAVSLEGDTPYSELPNALRFQKTFDSTCTCKPPGRSWAEALGPAEQLLGRVRKSDIIVTPEKSAELARPKFETVAKPSPATQPPAEPGNQDNPAKADGQETTQEVTGPDGVKRHVRIIVPPL
jgi:hypothetical protein